MAAAELLPTLQEIIEPITWGLQRPPGIGRDETKEQEIRDKVRREDDSYVPTLKSLAEDKEERSGVRYLAMGYLVAFQNRNPKFDSAGLIGDLAQIARSADNSSEQLSRRDALYALAHLRDKFKVHPQALTKLRELAVLSMYWQQE